MELKFTNINILKGGIVMPFNVNNNFNNNQGAMNNNADKKKTNFRIGKLWGSDGQLDISIWVAQSGVFTTLTIKSAIGKDPATGVNVLEQKMPGDLPRFYMSISLVKALLQCIDSYTPEEIARINFEFDKDQKGGKLSIIGDGNVIKMTIDSKKQQGARTITFDPISAGSKNIHATFLVFCEYMKIAYKKALYNKLDPDEFAMAVGGGSDNDNDDMPI